MYYFRILKAIGLMMQELICVADHLGSMMQYETPGFLPNKRIHRAMGLATLEVMQAVQRT